MPIRTDGHVRGGPMSFLRWHFRRREDPYAGADMARATRLAGVLWVLGAVVVVSLLPVAPPTEAIGPAGWTAAALIVVGALLAAVRAFKWTDRVSANEGLTTCLCALVLIAALEWLAGVRTSPYNHLLMLSVLYTASAH